MHIDTQKPYAVITGDVVRSGRLPENARKRMYRVLQEAGENLQKAFPEAVPLPPDIYRGDAWQALVAMPSLALRAALFFRARLRAQMGAHHTDCRMAIAVGKVDFVPGDRISRGDGPAFRHSGRLMENMPRQHRMAFTLVDGQSLLPAAKALEVMIYLVDVLGARWSEKQALAVTGALRDWTQEATAKKCWPTPISQQAVAQHLDRAGWNALEKALEYFETTVAEVAERQTDTDVR